MARLEAWHSDTYELRTRRERVYLYYQLKGPTENLEENRAFDIGKLEPKATKPEIDIEWADMDELDELDELSQ